MPLPHRLQPERPVFRRARPVSAQPTAPALPPATLLQLIWLASPALPVGGFSYSEGLEAAVDRGVAVNEAQVQAWLADQLSLSQGRADLPVLAQGICAWQTGDLAQVQALNRWVLDTRESFELRQQTEQMGRSLLDWLRNQPGADDPRLASCAALPPTWPLAFALAVARSGAPVREGLLAYAFGWAENLAQAAMKAVPLGQSAGQRILAHLAQHIPTVVDQALTRTLPQAFTPGLAIMSAQHETQYSRLFRS